MPTTTSNRSTKLAVRVGAGPVRALAPIARVGFALLALVVTALAIWSTDPASAQSPNVRPPAGASLPAGPPGAVPERPGNYDIEMWRKVRGGSEGRVSIPDSKAGRFVDSSGEEWRNLRNGPLPTYGAYALSGMVALLALFYLVRGKVRIDHGLAGRTIERFSNMERTGHWLLATSFIILAFTGLNVLYGRYVLLPVVGKEAFAFVSIWGKWLHNYVAFAFMVGLLLTFVMWVRHNFPTLRDIQWFAMGGGVLIKGVHPPAWKFNAGQKVLFWLVMLGGLSISLSGLSMMFPYEMPLFAKTFGIINAVTGAGLSTTLTPNQEMQYAATWHGIVALFLVAVIIAHIYIGSIGMQGAFQAMGSGQVDVNWAKEHHSLWADEVLKGGGAATGAHGGSGAGSHAKPAPAE